MAGGGCEGSDGNGDGERRWTTRETGEGAGGGLLRDNTGRFAREKWVEVVEGRGGGCDGAVGGG